MHTDLDRKSFARLPLESQSSSLSSLVTLSSPGVAADSNGLFHGLGDHASNSFSIDGQPITDQQSKVFSNQIPADSVQSIEVIDGAPPAEYGDKTSLVIKVTTRSGQGVAKPTGSVTTSYGSFGSSTAGLDVAYGAANWGNFIAASGLNTGRFLDGPEYSVFHDKGNEENLFDRVDYQISPGDSLHLNLQYTRSWFQTPNSYDNLNVHDQFGNPVGNADQKSKIETFNIAPTYTRLMSQYSVLNLGAYVRKDAYNYYPSGNPLADLGPPNLQRETIGQQRTLTNAGLHSDISYVRGKHNIKAGAEYEQTFLRENDRLAAVDPKLNAPCIDLSGNSVDGFTSPSQCAAAGYQENSAFLSVLLPYDLTRGGSLYNYFGHTDVKEIALYVEDQITKGNWLFNVGIRGDLYNGLTVARQAEPRLGVSYSVKPTNTVLRVSYARTLETPFNENLVLSSNGCTNAVLNPLLSCVPGVSGTLAPGFRNEFHAGLQQAFSRYFVLSGEYLWKYTHNAFDFSVLGNTPITFPIDWHNSKISGFVLKGNIPETHNFSAFVVMSSVAARFFPPQTAGAGATVGQNGLPFRIDHDEKFNQTTHLQYQVGHRGPWLGFNWRYDSGLVAASVPFAINDTTPVDLTGLTADQQQQAGLACGSQRATLSTPLTTCAPSQYHSSLVSIPAPGTENDDHNPPRIAPRSLFDAVVGDDNLFHGDRYKWSANITAVNLTNKYALYNFLSTF
ncbi:MAG TPA: TonB-dependent receptor plug domain-containing protein, partial [Acidobacteriaceae bacterium]|nr:TonB-dependent receptor plug domain-containing protein [Acidobacteriaceae bacterium]